ncbi:aspartate aminotransferase family protein [Synechococcus sp. CBW1107]|uniref:aspartate aminotransferase family protein n=1 Tax=Synechococcus sp. CBW1107 TaxID=2789857 RepID=UPI0018CEE199|nr:aspartate aminotransferase family protein [Synechococcus sp. CBW1107]QPN58121.1 aspartate aminotransferase family protein [Synechococcus sp. CBW1107]CAK6693551.1 Acetylornithine aminotransferase [Synechococcus sp. CBW1107]
MDTYARLPLELVEGRGVWVRDRQGRRYLDCVAGIATCTLGHSDRVMRRALSRQLGRLQHVSNLYKIPEQEDLARWIVSRSCADRVFFCNSGAEANEAAIKLARKHGHQVRGIERPLILTAQASFHGRTLATVSATGQPKYHQGFEPMVEGFHFFPYNDTAAFEALLSRSEADGARVAAVMLEPLQGEGGVNPGDPAFFQRVRQLCDEHRILLIFDEVQIGMGRSGCLWGYEKLGVEPDAFTTAKGLGGGFPIGALAVKQAFDHFRPGDHASTFGGNPLACRAGLTVAQELERRLLVPHVQRMGELLQQLLAELVGRHPQLLEGVRGWGLLQGLVLRPEAPTAPQIVQSAIEKGLLVVPAGPRVVRLVPPLVIQPRQLRQAVALLEQALLAISERV